MRVKTWICYLCCLWLCSPLLLAKTHEAASSPMETLRDYFRQQPRPQKNFHALLVNSQTQELHYLKKLKVVKKYPISTSQFGLGEVAQSYQTPRGLHLISEKIGDHVPLYGIFQARRYIGKTWQPALFQQFKRDYIVTRILRLKGLEPGQNQGADAKGRNVDSHQRTIYIHGTSRESQVGTPISIGCVMMRSKDVLNLYNQVPVGTIVLIA